MVESNDWVRVRGMGRERFAGYLAEYLESVGYSVVRTDSEEQSETHVVGELTRMNPAIPESARKVQFRLTPTSGGAAVAWEGPTLVPESERPRLERMVREFVAHLERAVSTETHATAKVTPAPKARLPWNPPTGASA